MKKKGFTLVELIVVIAILGILALLIVPQVTGYTKQAKQARVLANCKTISNTLAMDEALHPEEWTNKEDRAETVFSTSGATGTFEPYMNETILAFTYTEDDLEATYDGSACSVDDVVPVDPTITGFTRYTKKEWKDLATSEKEKAIENNLKVLNTYLGSKLGNALKDVANNLGITGDFSVNQSYVVLDHKGTTINKMFDENGKEYKVKNFDAYTLTNGIFGELDGKSIQFTKTKAYLKEISEGKYSSEILYYKIENEIKNIDYYYNPSTGYFGTDESRAK